MRLQVSFCFMFVWSGFGVWKSCGPKLNFDACVIVMAWISDDLLQNFITIMLDCHVSMLIFMLMFMSILDFYDEVWFCRSNEHGNGTWHDGLMVRQLPWKWKHEV